jgi:hypothetical protein
MTGTRAVARPRRTTARITSARLTAGVVMALLAASACSPGADEQASPTVTQAAEATTPKSVPPQPVRPKPKPEPVVWPLTGVRVDGNRLPMRPALAVKIENSPESRPHRGLHTADIVWEQVVEGGVSRFVAVYHSKRPDAVGPVRSVRPMDAATVAPLKGILAFSGGQNPFIERVRKAGVQPIIMDDGAPGFWRSSDRYAPHNVYGSPRSFWKQAKKSRAERPPAQFDHAAKRGEGTAARTGRRARVADVRLSDLQRTVWRWKPKQQAYARSDGGAPSISSGRQITARNVVVLSVAVRNTRFRDPGGAPVPETRMVGAGRGVLLADGRAVSVRWRKEGPRQRIELERANGKPVELEPGNVWIELVPRGTGSWRVR